MIIFACLVLAVHDGDGPLRCASGEKIRIAGVQAPDFTTAEPCQQHRAEYVCDDAAAEHARDIVSRMVLNRTLQCEPYGMSYARVVARCTLPDGRDLSCAVIAAGAGARWDRYWQRYRLPECR